MPQELEKQKLKLKLMQIHFKLISSTNNCTLLCDSIARQTDRPKSDKPTDRPTDARPT